MIPDTLVQYVVPDMDILVNGQLSRMPLFKCAVVSCNSDDVHSDAADDDNDTVIGIAQLKTFSCTKY